MIRLGKARDSEKSSEVEEGVAKDDTQEASE
jgi:hypothetical protein